MKIWVKKVEGTENIPHNTDCVFCPNHSSYLDDFLVPAVPISQTKRITHMYVNRNYFKFFLFRWFLNLVQSIPVEVHKVPDKHEVNQRAFRQALGYLKIGDFICIYPEGRRTIDGELQKAKTGAAKLAITAKVPIVPVGVIGTLEAWPKGKMFPKLNKKVTLKFGKPISTKGLYKYMGTKQEKLTTEKTIRKVMQSIGKLINKEYRY